jgi:flagellar motor switch protein FliM
MISSPESKETMRAEEDHAGESTTREISSCNFRYVGRLSNENARALTALHERFAMNVTTALELYLGASLRVKLRPLEQMSIADHIGGIDSNSYLLPSALNVMDSNLLMEMDIELVFPIIDVLLGGTGTPAAEPRELTEIDEEIMNGVTSLILKEIERTWKIQNLSLTPGRCIKPAMIQQVFQMNERLVLLKFEITLGETTGSFNIMLTTSFVGFLLRHLNARQSKKISSLRPFRNQSLRERILDCDFVMSEDITQIQVRVKDLIEIKPGMILKMKAPVKKVGRLTIEDLEVFAAMPVRSGLRKAAQVLSVLQEPGETKE